MTGVLGAKKTKRTGSRDISNEINRKKHDHDIIRASGGGTSLAQLPGSGKKRLPHSRLLKKHKKMTTIGIVREPTRTAPGALLRDRITGPPTIQKKKT